MVRRGIGGQKRALRRVDYIEKRIIVKPRQRRICSRDTRARRVADEPRRALLNCGKVRESRSFCGDGRVPVPAALTKERASAWSALIPKKEEAAEPNV